MCMCVFVGLLLGSLWAYDHLKIVSLYVRVKVETNLLTMGMALSDRRGFTGGPRGPWPPRRREAALGHGQCAPRFWGKKMTFQTFNLTFFSINTQIFTLSHLGLNTLNATGALIGR